ncbi:hypothetical protein ACQ4WX_37845 [Streptomyces lasalocidi]
MRAEGFVGAQTLHNHLAADGSPVGLSTVYRTLTALATAAAGPTWSATQAANASSATAPAPTTATTSSAPNAASAVPSTPARWRTGPTPSHGPPGSRTSSTRWSCPGCARTAADSVRRPNEGECERQAPSSTDITSTLHRLRGLLETECGGWVCAGQARCRGG